VKVVIKMLLRNFPQRCPFWY